MKKKILTICFILLSASLFAQTQAITTAGSFFKTVSEYYAGIKDYEASFTITAAGKNMTGTVSFRSPNLLRLDFSEPKEQVYLFAGNKLTVYLPEKSATLIQELESVEETDTTSDVNSLVTPQGLSLMNRYYYISYEVGQNPEPLSEENPEKVIKLNLKAKSTSEGFDTINLAVNPDTKLIRRVEGITPAGESFEIMFSGYILNSDIPDARFVYTSPSSSNNYYNFLLTE